MLACNCREEQKQHHRIFTDKTTRAVLQAEANRGSPLDKQALQPSLDPLKALCAPNSRWRSTTSQIVLTFKCILKHHKANVANNNTFLDILMQKKKQICTRTTIAGVMVDEHLYWNPWSVLIHQEINCKNFLKMILLLLVDHELINIQILRVEYHGCNKEWVNASCDAQVAVVALLALIFQPNSSNTNEFAVQSGSTRCSCWCP